MTNTYEDDFPELDDDGYPKQWCREFEAHGAANAHDFCAHHQMNFCRLCERDCPACYDDPRCPDCGCAVFEEYHDWDCSYADEDDE